MRSIIGKSKVDYIKCYQMCMGKQNKSLALVLTSFSALVAQGVTRSKSSIQGGSRMTLVYCSFLVVELKFEISVYPGTELSIP